MRRARARGVDRRPHREPSGGRPVRNDRARVTRPASGTAGLGAAHLEVVGDVVCEAVQHAIARQAEDVVDAVVLAPRHGLGPAVVAVSPEGEPGARPVPADAAHQVLEEGADLGARRRLARAQENRHRLAALHVVDVDRQEAASVVVGVEQRELLAAVHRVAGVVDVERDGRGRGGEGAAEEIDQRRGHPCHLKPRGRVFQPAHGRLRAQGAAALRRLAHGQLEQGIGAQGVAVVGILVSTRDREHTEAQHRRERVDHQRWVAPLPDAARKRLGQPEPAFRLVQQDQPAVRRDQPAPEIGGHLLAFDGWKVEREQSIFGHGGRGAFVAREEMRFAPTFYPISTIYAMSAITTSDPAE